HGADGRRSDPRQQCGSRPRAASLDRVDGQRTRPVRIAAQRSAGDLPPRRRRRRVVGRVGRPAFHRAQRVGQCGASGRRRRYRTAHGFARTRGDRGGGLAPGGAHPAQPDRQRHRPRRTQAGADPDGRGRGHRRGHRPRLRGGAAAGGGETGVQPVLAVGPVPGAPLRRHRSGPGHQRRGRPPAPGPARSLGRAGQGGLLPAHPAAGARSQGDDQPAAAQTDGRVRCAGGPAGQQTSGTGGRRRVTRRFLILIAVTMIGVLTGCAGVPSSSSPQAVGTVERPAPPTLPKPTPDMVPDVLLREFLKATADPANRHLAARQFLTESASQGWDDAGGALLVDRVGFVENSGPQRVSVSMRADILGSLSDMGVFETAEGELPDPGPIELVRTPDGWRIDKLPNGVFLDWQQFQETYRRHTLYFADNTGSTVVPDPRYVAVSDPDQLATELVSKLIVGPRPEMAGTVRNLLEPPLRLRGPVTRA